MTAKIVEQSFRKMAMIFAVAILASCASGSAQAEPDVESYPTVESTSEIVLPLDAYQLSQSEYLNLQRAAWRLTGQCVERFGGDYTLPEVAVLTDVPEFEHTNERRYGVFDATTAAEFGYRLRPDQLPPGDDRPFAWNPSDAELLLLEGPTEGATTPVPTDDQGASLPDDGCRGDADRVLDQGVTSDAPVDENLAATLSGEAFRRSEADHRVRDAMGAWSGCMAERGYSYDTVWGPNDFHWPDPVGDDEVSTATADVACKQEVNLVGVWLAVETAYQDQLIEEHAEELTTVQDLVQARAANAAQVVSGG